MRALLLVAALVLAGAGVSPLLSGCAGSSRGRGADEPRAIVVSPTGGGGAAVATAPGPAAPREEAVPLEIALDMNRICVRALGHVHCTAELAPERPLTSTPPVEGIEDAVSLAMGNDFGCAVTGAGAVMCFGDNTYGQLGAGLRAPRSDTPAAVLGVSGAKRVVAGEAHACALLGDGTVRCWGRNANGQTGSATSYLPAAHELVTAEAVPLVQDATVLAASSATTCAGGRGLPVTCWGQALLGADDALAQPPKNERPTVVAHLNGLEDLTGSDGALCGIRGGEVACWGETWSLVKGSAVGNRKRLGVEVTRARRVRMARSHACALLADGTVTCWGNNYYGALGRGESAGFDALPAETVRGLPYVADIAVGGAMACAITSSPDVYCWGSWPNGGRTPRKEATPVKLRISE